MNTNYEKQRVESTRGKFIKRWDQFLLVGVLYTIAAGSDANNTEWKNVIPGLVAYWVGLPLLFAWCLAIGKCEKCRSEGTLLSCKCKERLCLSCSISHYFKPQECFLSFMK